MGRAVVILVFILAVVNIAVLDVLWVTREETPVTKQEITNIIRETAVAGSTETTNTACADSCLTAIKEATAEATAATPSPQSTTASSPSSGSLREYFVTIATGSFNSTNEFKDVPGAQVTVDGSGYGTIQKAVFEATVNTPSGDQDVRLRLYNVTDDRPVWYSDLFFPSGSDTRFLVTQPITLEPGNRIYQVQMQTQYGTNVDLDVARIHIMAY